MTKKPTTDSTDFLAELGLDDLPEDAQNELYAQIGELVFRGAMRRVWNVLDIKEQDTLTLLLEESADDSENDKKHVAIDAFLKANVPDFERYVSDELEALKKAQEAALGEIL